MAHGHTELHLDRARRLAARALEAGATRVNLTTIRWDISGGCEAPIRWVYAGRPAEEGTKYVTVGPGKPAPFYVEIDRPCRRCGHCKKVRANQWTYRAVQEVRAASRTWFCTFTLNPENQLRLTAAARRKCSKSGYDFDGASDAERYSIRCKLLGYEVTKYLKRLRKQSRARFKYLVAFEMHDSEETSEEYRQKPHVHMLLHEPDEENVVRKKLIQGQWAFGYSTAKLTADDLSPAFYISKYISKALLVRVRASQGYGKGTEALPNPLKGKLPEGEFSTERRKEKTDPIKNNALKEKLAEGARLFYYGLYSQKMEGNDVELPDSLPQDVSGLSNKRHEPADPPGLASFQSPGEHKQTRATEAGEPEFDILGRRLSNAVRARRGNTVLKLRSGGNARRVGWLFHVRRAGVSQPSDSREGGGPSKLAPRDES